jgi:preprotein translocase subunit SecA
MSLLKNLFGSRNDREIARINKLVVRINALEPGLKSKSEAQIKAQSEKLQERCQQGGEALDDLLPEAFALVREAARRTIGLRPYDVQLIGGVALHEGKIAEMGTGEGKTLVGTLAIYLNALTGKGTHVVTVNSYLAKRDAAWMEPVYTYLGMKLGVIHEDQGPEEKKQAYDADITYGTNNEFGFDYLRDNMVFDVKHKVQRQLHFALVDEVDSILIDEARTPLIISGEVDESSEMYPRVLQYAKQLKKTDDFTIDEKEKGVHLTDEGHQRIEALFIKGGLLSDAQGSLYDRSNLSLLHYLNAVMRALYLFQNDVDYIKRNDEIVIIDEHTGRAMPGRRWSDGLHQAIEAKEGVSINKENQTLASVTFQNYFRMYDKLAGMTGTADTEAVELQQIYSLEVLVIPTNKAIARKDADDLIFMTQKEKYAAIVDQIKDKHAKGQPILVGTASIEVSEVVAALLKKEKIKHQILNAKNHAKEAHIIEQAGCLNAVTIATNMAGRGTDIVLGGNVDAEIAQLKKPSVKRVEAMRTAWKDNHKKVKKLGGLFVLGTERHESRRIDNQLRGRCGRQGDPGASLFCLSLEDNLLRIFASDRVSGFMRSLNKEEGAALAAPMLNRAIENAQRKVEGYYFDIRKQLLKYDDVANEQRGIIYDQRAQMLEKDDLSAMLQALRVEVVEDLMARFLPQDEQEQAWNISGFEDVLANELFCAFSIDTWLEENPGKIIELAPIIVAKLQESYLKSMEMADPNGARKAEKGLMLHTLDMHWKEYLVSVDYLRQGIHLRSYAQKNPEQEFKKELFELFNETLASIRYEIVRHCAAIRVQDDSAQAQPSLLGNAFGLGSDYSVTDHGVTFRHETEE